MVKFIHIHFLPRRYPEVSISDFDGTFLRDRLPTKPSETTFQLPIGYFLRYIYLKDSNLYNSNETDVKDEFSKNWKYFSKVSLAKEGFRQAEISRETLQIKRVSGYWRIVCRNQTIPHGLVWFPHIICRYLENRLSYSVFLKISVLRGPYCGQIYLVEMFWIFKKYVV